MGGSVFLTIDIESDWGGRAKTVHAVVELVPRLLELLSASNSKATFFVSTDCLAAYASTILRIHEAGHEIASHGHRHDIVYDQLSRDELHMELQQSSQLLEDLIGAQIIGFRTPQFRKHALTEEVLMGLGYEYDSSSVNTTLSGRYKSRQHECGLLPEYPVSTVLNKFPAGIKWVNLLKAGLDVQQHNTVYLHMFDLMSLKQLISTSFGISIPLEVQAFYAARIGSPFNTVENMLKKYGPSRTIQSELRN